MKMNKTFWGNLKKYGKCYKIMYHFKLHTLHVCLIIIFPYFISVRMTFQVVISTGSIFENI